MTNKVACPQVGHFIVKGTMKKRIRCKKPNCNAPPMKTGGFCYFHSPDPVHAAQREATRSLGLKAIRKRDPEQALETIPPENYPKTLAEVYDWLGQLLARVESGQMSVKKGDLLKGIGLLMVRSLESKEISSRLDLLENNHER